MVAASLCLCPETQSFAHHDLPLWCALTVRWIPQPRTTSMQDMHTAATAIFTARYDLLRSHNVSLSCKNWKAYTLMDSEEGF